MPEENTVRVQLKCIYASPHGAGASGDIIRLPASVAQDLYDKMLAAPAPEQTQARPGVESAEAVAERAMQAEKKRKVSEQGVTTEIPAQEPGPLQTPDPKLTGQEQEPQEPAQEAKGKGKK